MLVVVVMITNWIPARRASRIEPISVPIKVNVDVHQALESRASGTSTGHGHARGHGHGLLQLPYPNVAVAQGIRVILQHERRFGVMRFVLWLSDVHRWAFNGDMVLNEHAVV